MSQVLKDAQKFIEERQDLERQMAEKKAEFKILSKQFKEKKAELMDKYGIGSLKELSTRIKELETELRTLMEEAEECGSI